ncbi:fimbrial protein [Providencia sp. Me31A]|uniref:fimbrial protein n=1 Tax=Providencia sp. Me31A TaxID=3392637 RepID=UPI003D2962BE
MNMHKLIRKRVSLGGLLFSLVFSVCADNSAQINLRGNLLGDPPCDISASDGRNTISVDFGEMLITNMDTTVAGRTYKKPLPYKIVCTTPVNTAIKVTLSSDAPSSFDSRFVSTNNVNVGIMFLTNNALFSRGTNALMNYGNEAKFEVVPIKNGAANIKVAAGDLTSTATLTVSYQ